MMMFPVIIIVIVVVMIIVKRISIVNILKGQYKKFLWGIDNK